MKIIELRAENLKRLKAVQIRPDGALVQITGKNGAGKTSVLDAITMALAGKGAIPEQPIRAGETHAEVVLDLGDMQVTRTWTEHDTYLTVRGADGIKFQSPQSVLDKLVGRISFDPLAFSRLSTKDQAETLRAVVGLDFSDLDGRQKVQFETRQAINRDVRNLEGQLDGMPVHDAPPELVNLAELLVEHDYATTQTQDNQSRRDKLEAMRASAVDLGDQIEQLKAQLEAKRRELMDLEASIWANATTVEALVDPDMSAIKERVASAEHTNELVRSNQRRAEIAKECDAKRTRSLAISENLRRIAAEREDRLKSAKFPIDGLGFSENGVTFKSLPFSQLSSAEQLTISVAMGLAMNPSLRVMLVRDGSLLDHTSLGVIASMAEQSDAQVWIERVTDGEAVGVVIEDGEVKAGARV